MAVKVSQINQYNIGDWPWYLKIGIVFLIFLGVTTLGYWLYAKPTLSHYQQIKEKEANLKKIIKRKMRVAVNFEIYQKRMKQLHTVYHAMMSQLPESKEIPQLIDAITQEGLDAGLTFRLIKPLSEQVSGFYSRLPIKMVVTGNYNQLGDFISGVSQLSRIVIINDFTLEPVQNNAKKNAMTQLNMKINASTYRYHTDNIDSDILPH